MAKATKRRKEPVIFAVSKEGDQLFVKLRHSGISPLICICDGISVVFFGNEKTAYLRIPDVLGWFERELTHDPSNGTYQNAIAAYRRILEKFATGKIEEAS